MRSRAYKNFQIVRSTYLYYQSFTQPKLKSMTQISNQFNKTKTLYIQHRQVYIWVCVCVCVFVSKYIDINLHGWEGYVSHWEDQAKESQSYKLHFLVLLSLRKKTKHKKPSHEHSIITWYHSKTYDPPKLRMGYRKRKHNQLFIALYTANWTWLWLYDRISTSYNVSLSTFKQKSLCLE